MRSSRPCGHTDVALLGRIRDGGSIVFSRSHAPFREDLVLRDPLERLLEDFLRIGLEYDPLARPPATRIHDSVETVREFVLVVMGVKFRPQVNIALRAAQGVEVSPNVL